MKKLNFKKVSYVAIPLVCLIFGVMIVKPFSSSSVIKLKDQAKIDRIILHNEKGGHQCHCFPPMIATNPGFAISKITATSVSCRWVCDVAATYQVTYGTTNSKGTLFPTTKPTTTYKDYTVIVTGLKANTTYHFGPHSQGSGRSDFKEWLMSDRTQNDWTATTAKATAVLEETPEPSSSTIDISDVKADKISTSEATITWKTNLRSTSEVEYGTTNNYGSKSGENTELTTDHYIQIFDLKPGATYYYKVNSRTGEGKAPFSASNFTLTTQAVEKRIADNNNFFADPNPCVNKTEFNYFLYQSINKLTIDIFTLSGKKLAVLEAPSSALNTGWNRISWDVKDRSGTPLINGVYVYKMKFAMGKNEQLFRSAQFSVRR